MRIIHFEICRPYIKINLKINISGINAPISSSSGSSKFGYDALNILDH